MTCFSLRFDPLPPIRYLGLLSENRFGLRRLNHERPVASHWWRIHRRAAQVHVICPPRHPQPQGWCPTSVRPAASRCPRGQATGGRAIRVPSVQRTSSPTSGTPPRVSDAAKPLAYDGVMGDATHRPNLPSFEHPPVIEVAVGAHFLQLPGLNTVALVRLADIWRDRYPTIQEQPALPPVSPVAPGSQVMMFQVQNVPPPQRFWLLSENQSMLVQIQHDRLLLNWRKLGDDDPYPRYGRLREDFSALWSDFARFVTAGDYGAFQPSLAEVTFFNRIPAASASAVPEAIAALNPHWSLEGHHATSFQIERAISSPGGRSGQQNIALGYRSQTGFIHLEITSRIGIDTGSNDSTAILAALDDAHDIDVVAFDQITTESAHTAWGKYNVSAN